MSSAEKPSSVGPGASSTPGPDAVYRAKLREGKFELQRCGSCGSVIFYPRVSCNSCGSGDMAWIRPSGRGIVYSTTVVRRKAEDGGDYNVAIVELAEGPRLMSRIEGCTPEEVQIGQPVRASLKETNGEPVLIFLPDLQGA